MVATDTDMEAYVSKRKHKLNFLYKGALPPGDCPEEVWEEGWRNPTWTQLRPVERVGDLRPVINDQPEPIRRVYTRALDLLALDRRKNLSFRIALGYRGDYGDEDYLNYRMAWALRNFGEGLTDFTHREKLFFPKDHEGAELETTFREFGNLLTERFAEVGRLEPKMTWGRRVSVGIRL